MSSLWVKTWKSTPQIDCGLCGEATCASFARALIVGRTEIGKCPLLVLDRYKDSSEELELLSKRRPTLIGKPAAKLPEGGMLLTRPCQDTDEKVMAELRVYNGVEAGEPIHFGVFEPSLLCDLMDCISDRFELIRCSRDLGYGRAEIEDMSITILQDGRVNMRRVSDEQRVLELFRQIERAIFGSIICNCCGHGVLSVLSGFAPLENEPHTVLSAGSTLSLDPEILENRMTSPQTRSILQKAGVLERIEIAVEQFNILLTRIGARDFSATDMEPSLESSFCSIVNVAVNSTDDAIFTIALVALAIVKAVKNATAGLSELQIILREGTESLVDAGLELLSKAAVGQLSPVLDYSDDLIEIVAHLTRVNRTINLLRDHGWDF
ncbi:MAG: (Fe-S)-binding protein [Candidatus Thorarchaeota archaeon]